jgi:PhnB protein
MELRLKPYLFFTGNCREAMEFYHSVFGGELTLQTQAEMLGEHATSPDSIMHAELTNGMMHMMASDGTRTEPYETSSISLSLNGADEPEFHEVFAKLAEGGTITDPLKTESWGDTFGTLTDKFGMDWMMNLSPKQ